MTISWDSIKRHSSIWSCKDCGDFRPGQCSNCQGQFSYLNHTSPNIEELNDILNTITKFNNEKNNIKDILYTWKDYETDHEKDEHDAGANDEDDIGYYNNWDNTW